MFPCQIKPKTCSDNTYLYTKIMKKTQVYISIFFCLFFSHNTSFWEEDFCGSQKWFSLYECRVTNICDTYKSEKPVYASKKYMQADGVEQEFQNGNNQAPAIDAAKKIYRENMSNIYKCAMIQSQRNSLNSMKTSLKWELSWQLSDALEWQINQRISRLELTSNTVGCSLTDNQTQQNKLNILRETTRQLCIYTSYLEYVKWYYEQTWNAFERSNPNDSQILSDFYDTNTLNQLTKVTPSKLSSQINAAKNEIAREISHTYKIFPIAFQAYSEYENNFPIHVLLEVVKWDFLILRQLMYQNLMPISQLWLKVINAMSF